MTADSTSLTFRLTAQTQEIASIEGAIGRHLVRFGQRDELMVCWQRADGSAGTTQGEPETP